MLDFPLFFAASPLSFDKSIPISVALLTVKFPHCNFSKEISLINVFFSSCNTKFSDST